MAGARRIGIYGGTFNPIHVAHLALAEEIRERLDLERVLFVPSNLPPHKGEHLPSGVERLALVRLAIRGNPAFRAIDLEVRRGGMSYTADTLREVSLREIKKVPTLRGRLVVNLFLEASTRTRSSSVENEMKSESEACNTAIGVVMPWGEKAP